MLYADLIIGRDGVKSASQKAVTGPDDRAIPAGDTAYHAVVSTGIMFEDPDLHLVVKMLGAIMWMAFCRHLGAYCITSAAREREF